MERSYGRYTQQARDYVRRRAEALSYCSSLAIAEQVRAIVAAHDEWRANEAISLNAAENILSIGARTLLQSDMATRVTEGFPGHKDFPADRQNRFVDELEATIIAMLGAMFRARHVEWRPVSTSMANATVFFALTSPGDTILVQPEEAGGNYSYNPNGPPRAARLDVRPLPFRHDSFEVDLAAAVDAIRRDAPKLVVIGGSNVLFPYPVAELRAAADRVGARLLYDAAHVALYIAFGMFQDPLGEGAHLLSFSSHKIMSGPVGGVILTNDDDLADAILPVSFPTFVQTRDQNKYAAHAYALAEMRAFGQAYARQTVANARALASVLEADGFEVLFPERGFTQTHQIFVLIADRDAAVFEDLCQQANLLVTRAQRMQDRSAIRLTTQEVTRRGMTEADMTTLSDWLKRIIIDREDPPRVAREIAEFLRAFGSLAFSFDP